MSEQKIDILIKGLVQKIKELPKDDDKDRLAMSFLLSFLENFAYETKIERHRLLGMLEVVKAELLKRFENGE